MSTLKDAILQRRMGESDSGHPCFSTGNEVSTLLVEASDGKNWLLPWHHFLHGSPNLTESITVEMAF